MSDIFSSPRLITLTNPSGMEVTLMDWGATIISIKVPVEGKLQEMLIGPAKGEDYKHQECYMGATIGRYANRINNCQFEANGKSYTVDMGGKSVALHGGVEGFDKRRFEVLSSSANTAVFKLHSQDGDQGFPGNFDLTVHYELKDDGSLVINYHASCDQECPACITNHSYFNLNGHRSSVLNHEGHFKSKEILVIDSKAIPTGEVFDVTAHNKPNGSPNNFNFTVPKLFAANGKDDFSDDKNMVYTNGYDHCFIVDANDIDARAGTKPCVTIRGETIQGTNKRVQLDVYTNYPAFQFYAGCAINQGVQEVAIARDDGKAYDPYDGFCIEPEYYPDAPHLTQFKEINPMVSPSAPLKKMVTYKFTVV